MDFTLFLNLRSLLAVPSLLRHIMKHVPKNSERSIFVFKVLIMWLSDRPFFFIY